MLFDASRHALLVLRYRKFRQYFTPKFRENLGPKDLIFEKFHKILA